MLCKHIRDLRQPPGLLGTSYPVLLAFTVVLGGFFSCCWSVIHHLHVMRVRHRALSKYKSEVFIVYLHFFVIVDNPVSSKVSGDVDAGIRHLSASRCTAGYKRVPVPAEIVALWKRSR